MNSRTRIQTLMDLAFSLLFVGPMTVLFWRGTFNSLTELAFSGLISTADKWKPALGLYLFGLIMKIAVDLTKHSLKEFLVSKGSGVQSLTTYVLLYLDAFFGVVLWVGGFNMLYAFPGLDWLSLLTVLFASTTFLIGIKAFHCTAGVPLSILTDEFETIYTPNSYFQTNPEESGSMKAVLDIVFTYSVVHTAVIGCWWSMWELENRYILFPCEITVKDIQAWDSVIIAYFLIFVVISVNKSLKEMKDDDGKFIKIAAGNCVAFLCFLATVNFWRGIWSLMDFYFFPSIDLWQNLLLSNVVGFLGTFLSGSSLSLTQSSKKDSTQPEFYSCSYFRKFGICEKQNLYTDIDQQNESSPLISHV